ncbi:MAG: hypothetical protein GY949_05025, partial [Gammaproteobacteria bacterium]|nr:hypothetical protein [Gammaproteobacteria bacterium]
MSLNVLKLLSLPKYERMLPRVFPGVAQLEIRDKQNQLFWQWSPAADRNDGDENVDDNPVVAWSALGVGIDKRQLPSGRLQFRAPIALKDHGTIAWLLVTYETQPSVALSSAPEPLRRAFADAQMLLQEDIELQLECNQLAAELGERYEELNLVYSTKDQVEYFEEGQEALLRLVHNCADYLEVGLAALICHDRGVNIHNVNSSQAPVDVDDVLELLATTVYDRVESQVQSIILNDAS